MPHYQRRLRDGAAVAALAIGISAAAAFTASAQTQTPPSDGTVQEVVVTARLREETLLETPLAITAFTADQLENRQIDSVRDLASQTPGLGFEQAASITSSRPVIRGLSQLARSSGDIANVGVFVDGVYSSGLSGTDLGFGGIERIEVIRGPQSALYGRNTFAGAINFITKKPGAVPEAGIRATGGEDDLWDISAFASAPFSDNFGMRIDASQSSTGGAFRNSTTNERLGDTDAKMVRGSFTFNPVSILRTFGSVSFQEDRTSPSPLIVIPDNSPRRVGKPAPTSRSPVQIGRRIAGVIDDYTETYSFDPAAVATRESYRGTFNAELDLGPVKLVSLTGYEDREVYTFVDLDQTARGTNFAGTVFTQTGSGDIEDRIEFSQDLRLQSSNPGFVDWVVGGYFSRERNLQSDTRFANPALGTGGTTAPLPNAFGGPSIDQQDLYRNVFRSIYGMATVNFTDALSLSAEGRQTWERKFYVTQQNNYGSDRGTNIGQTGQKTFAYFTPRVIANYNPNRSLNLYVSAAKGTKSGGFNPTAVIADEKTFTPESNWTYELGAKVGFMDNRGQVAAAVYHIDWTDQQILVFATGAASDTSITGNIGKSEVDGGEVQASFAFTRWFKVEGSYAYTNARYVDASTTSFANFVDCAALPRVECVNGVTTGRIDGNQLQFSPKHMFTIGGELTLPVYGDWDFYARADYSTSSKKYSDAGNVGWIPKREDLRLRAGFQNTDYKLHAFCDNVTNDKTPVTAFESRDFNGIPHYYVRARSGRTCGITASAVF
jgi:iron complex outermembrane receptor protein